MCRDWRVRNMVALRAVKTLSSEERIALARSVLARAEAAHTTTARSLGVPVIPVVEQLASLLPGGGLQCGSVLVFQGSTTLLLSLIARATQEGRWCAVVGFPELGGLAAAQNGVELARLALIPDPGQQVGQVLATVVDGLDLVIVGPGVAARYLTPAVQRQLSARIRERGTVLISLQDWPGAQQRLETSSARWHGLGQGWGHLTKQDLLLGRGGRGAHQRGIAAEVSLPLGVAGAS